MIQTEGKVPMIQTEGKVPMIQTEGKVRRRRVKFKLPSDDVVVLMAAIYAEDGDQITALAEKHKLSDGQRELLRRSAKLLLTKLGKRLG